jgi:hypothetical protein
VGNITTFAILRDAVLRTAPQDEDVCVAAFTNRVRRSAAA